MHSKLLGLSLITGLMSATAFAEPPIQAGDSLESLSKAKITTTVNGQAGSIQELVASGQIQIVDANQISGQNSQMATSAETGNLSTAVHSSTGNSQATAPVEQTAQVGFENVPAVQPHTDEVMAQQAEQLLPQHTETAPMMNSSAALPVNATESTQMDVTREAVAAAPATDTTMDQDAIAANPEMMQPNDAIQAIPVNTAPEMPMADSTEN